MSINLIETKGAFWMIELMQQLNPSNKQAYEAGVGDLFWRPIRTSRFLSLREEQKN